MNAPNILAAESGKETFANDEASPPRFSAGLILALLALGMCWALFFESVRGEWSLNAQYSFGWFVPALAGILFWRRWTQRPEPSAPNRPVAVGVVAIGLLFLGFPIRLLLEANPEWRLLYWMQGAQAIGLTGCFLFWAGGGAWLKYFAPPLLFALIATPWPMGLETTAIQGLMKLVAALTVEIANFMNIPCIQMGNLIEVCSGVVGIDEACSGVNSLQSALMISLFLGEQHRFTFLRRLGLVFGSLLFVVVANLGRTTFLVWAAATRGMSQMEKWHDTAGVMVMLLVLFGMFVLAWKLKMQPDETARALGQPLQMRTPPRWVGVGALAWIVLSLALTEIWYRVHEEKSQTNRRWAVIWPKDNPGFLERKIAERSQAMLRCSKSEGAAWTDNAGYQWSGFMLRWEPGRNSTQLAKGHTPDICFPAAGAKLLEDCGAIRLSAGGAALNFKHQIYNAGGREIHVFYCLSSDASAPGEANLPELVTQVSRVRAALAGIRNQGQQALEIVLEGAATPAEARELLTATLPNLIHRL